jgi:curved DNA-binding protein CbpA
MFKDYYHILKVTFDASQEEIRTAYKKQALHWHPDRNSSNEALKKMQDINEAYLILKDIEAKSRYDKEYIRYQDYQKSFDTSFEEANTSQTKDEQSKQQYEFHDDLLKKWMNNAREQAATLVAQTLAEFKVGVKSAGKEMLERFIGFIVVGLIFSLIFALSRGCN